MTSLTRRNKQKKWTSRIISEPYFFLPGYGMTIKNIDEATTAIKKGLAFK